MVSIVQRNNRYNVVYLYDDEATGKRKQKWESFKTMADAKRRKAEIEYRQGLGTMVIHQCKTVNELLKEYVSLYGKTTWSMSAYSSNTALIENYISPIIGNMKLSDVTARVLEKYYMQLLKTPSVHRITQKEGSKDVIFVAPPTVRKVHNVLRSAFHQAVKWELMEKNPAMYATVPKAETKKREIWDAPTLFHAIEVCEDERLKLSINLAFACSLRIGELLGLTWDCVDISPESIAAGKACIYVNKELQRVSKSVMKTLEKKDVLRVFPELRESNKTVLVLKKPNDEKLNMEKTILHHKEGVDLIPANIELSAIEVSLVNEMSRELIMRSLVERLREFYDFIIIDCMPSLGMMTINALACADSVLIPVQAAYLPVKGLQQLIKTIGRVKKQLNPKLRIEGILLTMVDNRTNYARDISLMVYDTYSASIKVFATGIPMSVRASEVSVEGGSIYSYDPKGKAAFAYMALTKEVLKEAE